MGAQRDILIRVYGRPNETSAYPVDATLDDDSYFPGGELQIPEEELLKLDLDLQPYGSRLGQCLFTVPILRALEKAYATVSSKSASQMRLRLCIDPNAADLHAYPWERLFIQWQGSAIPLAASSLIPFSPRSSNPSSALTPDSSTSKAMNPSHMQDSSATRRPSPSLKSHKSLRLRPHIRSFRSRQ